MKYRLYKEEDYSVSKWMGGKTKELAIFPGNSRYLDRDFIWRLSSATVELEESDFSKLPDYDRVLMVLEGNVVLTYDGKRSIRLKELEQDSFDGAQKTKSYGKITDFNLMVRKGGDGILDLIRPEGEAKECSDTLNTERSCTTHALYCREGYGVVSFGEEQKMINPGELLVMEFGKEEPAYTVMGDGVIIRAQIGYDYEEPEVAEDAPEKAAPKAEKPLGGGDRIVFNEPCKGTFGENFRWASFIANTQFRGARFISKKLNNIWYDDELNDRIHVLEKFFVTMIGFLFGLLVLLSIFARDGVADIRILIMLIIWLVADCVIVSPLIYLLCLPKPIASHIKEIDKMSEAEVERMIQVKGKNERLEKLLKKYKNSGRNLGRD